MTMRRNQFRLIVATAAFLFIPANLTRAADSTTQTTAQYLARCRQDKDWCGGHMGTFLTVEEIMRRINHAPRLWCLPATYSAETVSTQVVAWLKNIPKSAVRTPMRASKLRWKRSGPADRNSRAAAVSVVRV